MSNDHRITKTDWIQVDGLDNQPLALKIDCIESIEFQTRDMNTEPPTVCAKIYMTNRAVHYIKYQSGQKLAEFIDNNYGITILR